jgi:aspartate 1-decarboxylase
VISYAAYTREEIDLHVPRVVHVDEHNRIVAVDENADTLLS